MNAFLIISNNNLHLTSSDNIKQLFTIYGDWVKKVTGNLNQITGEVVKLNWAPDEVQEEHL